MITSLDCRTGAPAGSLEAAGGGRIYELMTLPKLAVNKLRNV